MFPSLEERDALWDRFYTGAPRGRTLSEQRYSDPLAGRQSHSECREAQASIAELAAQYSLNEKTVRKWRKRTSVEDARMGPKEVRSSVLTAEKEAMCVAFWRHTLLPLDDCLYALQATVPHLSRSALRRLFQRHGISRLPEVKGEPKSEAG